MPALSLVALGLALVAIDFRTAAPDLLPDVLGWLCVVVGARRLTMNRAAVVAGAAAVLSLSDVYLNFRYVLRDPVAHQIVDKCPSVVLPCPEELHYDMVGVWRAALIAGANIVGGAAIVLIAHRLTRIEIESATDRSIRRYSQLIMAAIPAGWVAPFVAVVAADTLADREYQPFWDGGLAFVSPVLMFVLLGVAGFLLHASHALGRSLEPGFRPAPHS